jgi:outer membrane cobalamin receptor
MSRHALLAVVMLWMGSVANAQEQSVPETSEPVALSQPKVGKSRQTAQYEQMSLEDLLTLEVAVASVLPQGRSEVPSVISVITREDIETYGARDATDILRMVPGFEFVNDSYAFYGASFRGIAVLEAKLLVMINGVPVNEYGYGMFVFFGTIPASIVDRVEIIRGPGSALYGGFAEAGVVNFITKPGAKLNGIEMTATGGVIGRNAVPRGGNLSLGGTFKEIELAVHLGNQRPQLGRIQPLWRGTSPPLRS